MFLAYLKLGQASRPKVELATAYESGSGVLAGALQMMRSHARQLSEFAAKSSKATKSFHVKRI